METCKDSVVIEDMVMQLVEMSVRAVSESVITGIKKDFPTFEVKVSEFLNLIHADAQWGVTVVTGIEGSSIFRNFAVLPATFTVGITPGTDVTWAGGLLVCNVLSILTFHDTVYLKGAFDGLQLVGHGWPF